MSATIETPLEFVESLRDLRLSPIADSRLQDLMDRNTEGALSDSEREELTWLVDWCERLSLVRAEAFRLLRQKP